MVLETWVLKHLHKMSSQQKQRNLSYILQRTEHFRIFPVKSKAHTMA